MPSFNWKKATVLEKVDGSLILLYCYGGEWRVNTRGSFADGELNFTGKSWSDWVWGAIPHRDEVLNLDPGCTYVMEFVSPYNKVVRNYSEPKLYLLTVVENETGVEWLVGEANQAASTLGILRPRLFDFDDLPQVQAFLREQEEKDPTFEGVVAQDDTGLRVKIKSSTYLGLHRLKGEGDNLFNPKHLLPFILAGEEDELLTYFPEVRGRFYELKCAVQDLYIDLLEAWCDHKDIEEQKEFALAIQKQPLSGILFNARKQRCQTTGEFRKLFRGSDHMLQKWCKNWNAS